MKCLKISYMHLFIIFIQGITLKQTEQFTDHDAFVATKEVLLVTDGQFPVHLRQNEGDGR